MRFLIHALRRVCLFVSAENLTVRERFSRSPGTTFAASSSTSSRRQPDRPLNRIGLRINSKCWSKPNSDDSGKGLSLNEIDVQSLPW
jgi:hypothetical protein